MFGLFRFINGQTNATHNCLDVHVANGFGDEVAMIHDSPVTGVVSKLTYKQLLDEVCFLSVIQFNQLFFC